MTADTLEPTRLGNQISTGATPAKCHLCGKEYEAVVIVICGRTMPQSAFCDTCEEMQERLAKEQVERQQAEKESRKDTSARERKWAKICPPRYNRFDAALLPERTSRHLAAVQAWEMQPKAIGFIGVSDRGKSILMYHAAKQLYLAGHSVHVVNLKNFSDEVAQFDSERRTAELARCKNCDVLFLDDIGKEKPTDRVESDFYGVLEHREMWEKPTWGSANSTGDELVKKYSQDRGAAIVERLRRMIDFKTC